MTWILWKALRYPQWKNPIFRYAQQEKTVAKSLAWYVYLLLILAGLAFAAFAAFFPIPALLSLLALAVGIPALTLVFNGTVLGLYWVSAIAENLARESRNGRSDLLNLTPDGAFAANWRLALGIIHRHDWLNTVYRLIKATVLLVLVVLGFACFMLLLGAFSAESSPERESQIRVLLDVLAIGLTLLFFWADHIQSIVLALLVGLLLPYYQRDEVLLKLLAPLSFLLLQVLNYLVAVALYLGLFNLLSQAYLLLAFIALIIFCSLRELLIRGLWQLYLQQSQASDALKIVRI